MLRARRLTPPRCARHRAAWIAAFTVILACRAQPAAAQIDPLLVVKRSIASFTSVDYRAQVLLVVDTSHRMQLGYEKVGSDYQQTYYDPYDFPRTGAAYESLALGLPGSYAAGAKYRRKYVNFRWGGPQYETDSIQAVPDTSAASYSTFFDASRLGAARLALIKAVQDNSPSAQFGLLKTRQQFPASPFPTYSTLGGTLSVTANANQQMMTDTGAAYWKVMRAAVSASDSSLATTVAPLVLADSSTANSSVVTVLQRTPTTANSFGASAALLSAGLDTSAFVDSPLETLLEDAKAEAVRLITADTRCRNTVVVLIAGGGENTNGHTPSAATTAATFKTLSGGGKTRRVPIYVIGLAPPASEEQQLRDIATASGGLYFPVTKEQIAAAVAQNIPVPELLKGVNAAVQHGLANQSDVNAAPTDNPFGPLSEFQVTSPIVGTVDLYQAKFADGSGVPDSESRITSPTGTALPQRSNLLVSSGFSLPGFSGRMHGFRVYKPVPDSTKPSGYRFDADGTKLWDAHPPLLGDGVTVDGSRRNIFTSLADGTVVAFTDANVASLGPAMRMPVSSADEVQRARDAINTVRGLPLGAIVSSTPAILDAPSVDPPPDEDYPVFMDTHKDRRTLVFVGANDGMLHAIDGRTGLELWAFIPYNLLAKLTALRNGQPVDRFVYTMDGSPKLADVRVIVSGTSVWRTYLILGQGSGGTFYQAFDVTMPGLESCVSKDSAAGESTLLGCFSDPGRIPLRWSFPDYSHFDPASGTWGDLNASATAVEKTVGQTWSDPAVGQIENENGTYAVLTGSGFFPRSSELSAGRGGTAAGHAFYLLDITTGSVTDWKDVGSDGKAETTDNCATTSPKGCAEIKNALQGDPVATGPPDSRFITKAYLGDLDGNLWRFDLGMVSGVPKFKSNPTKLYAAGADQPLFASMAAVTVSTKQYLFFGGGSDLLPTPGVNLSYKLYGLLEGQASPTFTYSLTKTDGAGDDEKVSAFPAVAGDIVFFSTTNLKPAAPCTQADANLYAFTFVGGAAYDSSGNDKVDKNESPKVTTLTAAGRATAPFIVDQHLWFGSGTKVSVFGDPQDFNNGVGQIGVRILSWRQVR